jgi:hypothetical protein
VPQQLPPPNTLKNASISASVWQLGA